MRYATLRAIGQGGVNGTVLPDLLKPELIGMVSDGVGLSRFEILDGIEYRQSWVVRTTIREWRLAASESE